MSDGGNGVRVLVLEDERNARTALVEWLGAAGYDARGCADGREAIELAANWRPAVLVCDVMMPGELDGIDVARRLQTDDPDLRVVVATAMPPGTVRPRLRELRIDSVLTKPYGLDELRHLVDEATEAGRGGNDRA